MGDRNIDEGMGPRIEHGLNTDASVVEWADVTGPLECKLKRRENMRSLFLGLAALAFILSIVFAVRFVLCSSFDVASSPPVMYAGFLINGGLALLASAIMSVGFAISGGLALVAAAVAKGDK
jgi:hypothetical protein